MNRKMRVHFRRIVEQFTVMDGIPECLIEDDGIRMGIKNRQSE